MVISIAPSYSHCFWPIFIVHWPAPWNAKKKRKVGSFRNPPNLLRVQQWYERGNVVHGVRRTQSCMKSIGASHPFIAGIGTLGLPKHVLSVNNRGQSFPHSLPKQPAIQTLRLSGRKGLYTGYVQGEGPTKGWFTLYPIKRFQEYSNSQPPSFDWVLSCTTLKVASILPIAVTSRDPYPN